MNILKMVGMILAALYLFWIIFCCYYGAARIYNMTQEGEYRYLGCLWIQKRKGEDCLCIPTELLRKSCTTKYKIIPEELFARKKQGKRIRICFANGYDVYARVAVEISVKNHIATSNQL